MNISEELQEFGLVKYVVNNGGALVPLVIPAEYTKGTGLMNPSIFNDNGTLLVNIRHINYTLYHSETKKFQHQFGPLQYLHPEHDQTLTTYNYMCVLNDDLSMKTVNKIDTSMLDVSPIWHFIGLEDARLFRWLGKLYLCGVRRDTTTNGEGRMELSEIQITNNGVREVSRTRIPVPGNHHSYCEKNWMPVADLPHHFVKWTNPTQLVEYNVYTKESDTVVLDDSKYISGYPDFRGGSQVIKLGDYYLAITHETLLFNSELGRKDGRYRHRFIMWDSNWNIIKITDSFSFMTGEIEFCCGTTLHQNDLLVSFGFQDNAAYILRIPVPVLLTILGIQ